MDFIDGFNDVWSRPETRHAMLVHGPIVLAMLGIPVALVLAFRLKKVAVFRTVTLGLFLAVAVSAWMAKSAGADAWNAVDGTISEAASAAYDEHFQHGNLIWLYAAAVAVLIGVSFVEKKAVRIIASWLAVAGSAAIGIETLNAAHFGGILVYDHGIGAGEREQVVVELPEPADTDDVLQTTDARAAFFVNEVRPILEQNCWRCHGAKPRVAAKLNQTTIEGILAGGSSGPGLVPGHADDSLMLQRMITDDEDELMPPDEPLDEASIAVIRRWIDDGAVWATAASSEAESDDDEAPSDPATN